MDKKNLFSYRKGIKKLDSIVQKEELREESKNKIWDIISLFIKKTDTDFVNDIFEKMWTDFDGNTLDTYNPFITGDDYRDYENYEELKEKFFNFKYNEIYDFIEQLISITKGAYDSELSKNFNNVFKRELIGYRIIDGKVTDIDNEEEYKEVEKASGENHIEKAIKLLYDRKNPDYKNSIKESISAVEKICKEITKSKNATLSECLKKLEKKEFYHPAFKDALNKLYGFTGDKGGIRHSDYKNKNLPTTFECAKFMLVICSAFVNYLKEKKVKLNE